MSRLGQQLERVERIVRAWKPGDSLARHLADHFAGHRNMGARDRRECRAWVYAWVRMGGVLLELPFGKRLAIACYLSAHEPYPALEALLEAEFPGDRYRDFQTSLDDKIRRVQADQPGFSLEAIFPAAHALSSRIDRHAFLRGIFHPPELWIRARTRDRRQVLEELEARSIPYHIDPELPNAIRLPNRTSIDELDATRNHRLEVQDRSSQATAGLFRASAGERWWDACAGSGGKSLLLLDQEPGVELSVSDRRDSILKNLGQRFRYAGLRPQAVFRCDLTDPAEDWPQAQFDTVLADVPCSGSGTWTRKPEGLHTVVNVAFFERFRSLQQKIVANLSHAVKPGGRLIYLTCSVFSTENEEMADWIVQQTGMKLQEMTYFEGSSYRADTLFGAVFHKE